MEKRNGSDAVMRVPSMSGSVGPGGSAGVALVPWQPNTWPETPASVDAVFIETLRKIFTESILAEIDNVISDARAQNATHDLQHRGHVVAISLMCALDAIASYGYKGRHIAEFVKAHFPAAYKGHAGKIYKLYRCSLVHRWNLFEAAILPGNDVISDAGGSLCFGLLNFHAALKEGVQRFLEKLETDLALQKKTLERYAKLRALS